MLREAMLLNKLKTVFEVPQAAVLAESIVEAYTDLVNTHDFSELKAIVKEIADTQKRTDLTNDFRELTAVVKDLAESQKDTDRKMAELAEAQKETQISLKEMQDGQKEMQISLKEMQDGQKEMQISLKGMQDSQKEMQNSLKALADALRDTRGEVGGLSRSISYALENEAYRLLPEFLRQQHGIEMTERLIRAEVGGEEINFFGKAVYQDKAVLIVGETKLRLDERRESRQAEHKILETLSRKIDAVRSEYPNETILPLLVTHYARPTFIKKAQAQGIVLVQSFEW